MFCLAGILVLTICGGWAIGDTIEHIPVFPEDWTSVRSTGPANGLTGKGAYEDNDAVKLEWLVTAYEAGSPFKYQYTYTFSGTGFDAQGGGLSHFTLDISDDAFSATGQLKDGVIENAQFKEGENDWEPIKPGDFEASGLLDGITSAVKFDLGGDTQPYAYQFDSNRPPVWGSFYVKGGLGEVANNALWQVDAKLTEEINWIAVPNSEDTGVIIPEPTGFLVWLGIVATCWIGVCRRR